MRNKKCEDHNIPQYVPVQLEPIWVKVVIVILCVTVLRVTVFIEKKRILSKTGHPRKMQRKYQIGRLACPNHLKVSQIFKTYLAQIQRPCRWCILGLQRDYGIGQRHENRRYLHVY